MSIFTLARIGDSDSDQPIILARENPPSLRQDGVSNKNWQKGKDARPMGAWVFIDRTLERRAGLSPVCPPVNRERGQLQP
jgi:hypothetical protein